MENQEIVKVIKEMGDGIKIEIREEVTALNEFKRDIKELVSMRLDNFKREIIELIDKHMDIFDKEVKAIDERVKELEVIVEEHEGRLMSVEGNIVELNERPLKTIFKNIIILAIIATLINLGAIYGGVLLIINTFK